MEINNPTITQEQFFAFSHVSKQMFCKEVALGVSLLDNRGLPHLYTAFEMLNSRIGVETLKNKWGEDYNNKMEIITSIAPDFIAIDSFLSKYDHQKIKDMAITNPEYVLYLKHMKNIYKDRKYGIFIDGFFTLLTNPQVNSLLIANNYWITFEQQYSPSVIVKQNDSNPLAREKG